MTAMTAERPIVLVVDDDEDIRHTLKEVLQDAGMQVLVARDGVDALEVLRAGPTPALIVLDLMMPRMNGWEFLTEQRRDAALSVIPVVVLTADSASGDRATELRVSGWIRKPVKLKTLLQGVAPFLRR